MEDQTQKEINERIKAAVKQWEKIMREDGDFVPRRSRPIKLPSVVIKDCIPAKQIPLLP